MCVHIERVCMDYKKEGTQYVKYYRSFGQRTFFFVNMYGQVDLCFMLLELFIIIPLSIHCIGDIMFMMSVMSIGHKHLTLISAAYYMHWSFVFSEN